MTVRVALPWPPASLSGHNEGGWCSKAPVVRKHREWARIATKAARPPAMCPVGDIPIHFAFTPPDNRGDRTNFPNRLKAYIDGIAEALGINDRRFLPSYEFCALAKPGGVEVTIIPMEVL